MESNLIIVQELNAPIKINRWLYLFDLFFLIGFVAVSFFFSRFVHSTLTIPYLLFSLIVAILLTLHSPYNPQKRIFQTVLFAIRKDRAGYHPISMRKEDDSDVLTDPVPKPPVKRPADDRPAADPVL